jgi:hypothetical protein
MNMPPGDGDPNSLKVGDRVRLSENGRRQSRIVDRKGVIIGVSKTGTRFRVLWDGLKLPAFFHHSFIERAGAECGEKKAF